MGAKLPDFDDRKAWSLYEDVNVFREHREVSPQTGREVRVDRGRLERIRDRLNDRDKSGQLCPISLGHTLKREYDRHGRLTFAPSEKQQPEFVGYARDWQVVYDKGLECYVLRAKKWYVAKDKEDEAKTYPRVSAEYYPGNNLIDPVSIIRRTPRLDLGQWTYAMDGRPNHDGAALMQGVPYRATGWAKNDESYQYEMGGWTVPDPVAPPDAKAADPALKQLVMQCIKEVLPELMAAMGGGGAAPSPAGGPSGLPPPSPGSPASPSPSSPSVPSPASPSPASAPSQHSVAADAHQFVIQMESLRNSREETRHKEYQSRLEALEAENKAAKQAVVLEQCKTIIQGLVAEDYSLDVAYELQQFAALPGPKEREDRAAYIRQHHSKAPVGGEMLHTWSPSLAEEPEQNAAADCRPDDIPWIERYYREHHAECQNRTEQENYAKALEFAKTKRGRSLRRAN